MKTTSIAFLLDASCWGGIEQHVVTLVETLQKQTSYQVYLIVWQRHSDESVYQRMATNLTAPVIFAQASYRRLLDLLKLYQINCLHTHGYKANLIGRMVKLHKRLRVISTHHNGDVGRGKVRLYTLLDQLSCGLVENWVVSKVIQQRLAPVKSVVITNFITCENKAASNVRGALFVGRMVTVKRPDRFLRLAESQENFQFHMIGDGPLADVIKKQLPINVQWHGYLSRAEQIWRHGDVCVLCSDDEGLPLTALEAMARGIPVIATPVGELPELIEHGVNGWLAASEKEQSAVLEQWRSMPSEQRKKMAVAARKTFQERYSVAACLPEYLALYH